MNSRLKGCQRPQCTVWRWESSLALYICMFSCLVYVTGTYKIRSVIISAHVLYWMWARRGLKQLQTVHRPMCGWQSTAGVSIPQPVSLIRPAAIFVNYAFLRSSAKFGTEIWLLPVKQYFFFCIQHKGFNPYPANVENMLSS